MRRYALLAGAQAAVGAAAIFARYALHDTKPLAVSAARLTIAALILLVIALLRRERPRAPVSARTNRHLVFAGLFLAAHFATWIASLDYTSVALSTLLVATTPIWTSLYEAIAKRRAPAPGVFVALGLGGAGLALVVGLGGAPAPLPGHGVLGAVLALTGAFAIAAYYVLVERVRREISTRGIVTRTYGVGAIALILASAAAHQGLPPPGDYGAWAGIAGMALVSQLLGHTALNSALRFFSASTVAFSSLFEPVIAAILAFFLFREALPPWSLAGAALIFAAIAIAIRNDRRGNLRGDRKP